MSYPKDPAYSHNYPRQQPYPPFGPPPPYSAQGAPQYPQNPQYGYGQPPMQGQYPPNAAPPPYGYQPPPNPGYPVQPGFSYGAPPANFVAQARYDSGARFDGIAGQNIPPPPPGCAPNAAQMASAQGGTVFATQDKASWFTGGKGGGVSFGL